MHHAGETVLGWFIEFSLHFTYIFWIWLYRNASCASLISFEVWIACFSSHRKPPFVECSFDSLIFVRAWAYLLWKELNSLVSLIFIWRVYRNWSFTWLVIKFYIKLVDHWIWYVWFLATVLRYKYGDIRVMIVLEICPRGNNKLIIIIFPWAASGIPKLGLLPLFLFLISRHPRLDTTSTQNFNRKLGKIR